MMWASASTTSQHHGLRQLDADRPVAVQLDLHHHAVLQEGRRGRRRSPSQLDLLVALGVHEHQLLALLVEELELPALDLGLLDAVAAAEALVELAAVEDVLQLDLVVGGALAGLHRAGLDRGPERAVVLDHHAGPDVAAADLGHECPSRFVLRADAPTPQRPSRLDRSATCWLSCRVRGARGNGLGPTGAMRAIQGLALFSATARSAGFMLLMKSSRY